MMLHSMIRPKSWQRPASWIQRSSLSSNIHSFCQPGSALTILDSVSSSSCCFKWSPNFLAKWHTLHEHNKSCQISYQCDVYVNYYIINSRKIWDLPVNLPLQLPNYLHIICIILWLYAWQSLINLCWTAKFKFNSTNILQWQSEPMPCQPP